MARRRGLFSRCGQGAVTTSALYNRIKNKLLGGVIKPNIKTNE